ncbi:lipoate--protein ligase [Eubacteriales bacterium OttesenSCG-928-N14]|nr:lipoate--protein ligase [Eubacteriales bacterium OttesenSCG-928-N14]
MKGKVYRIESNNPYRNLAVEGLLKEKAKAPTLLLWQNEHSVIIGRCQNAWAEVDIARCEQDGIHIARRNTGGGAVYHDLGNLNYSFIMPHQVQDVARQTQVIVKALKSLGIVSHPSGRNDLLVDDRKISGNAYATGENYLHHGTLLVDVDLERMQRYLTPNSAKLQSKGVSSVRSRVMNLIEVSPYITVDAIGDAIVRQFSEEYEAGRPSKLPQMPELGERTLHMASRHWRLNTSPPFETELERRFDWGLVQLHLDVKYGTVKAAQLYTDAFDLDLLERLPSLLLERMYGKEMALALEGETGHQADDLRSWFEEL